MNFTPNLIGDAGSLVLSNGSVFLIITTPICEMHRISEARNVVDTVLHLNI